MVFARNPIEGRVKTRLAASIGKEKAFRVYKSLLAYTESVVKKVDATIEIWYSEFVVTEDIWSGSDVVKRVQPAGNLGEKMSQAFRSGFEEGYHKIIIIGSDCHQLKATHIENAFQMLEDSDVVLGPSQDGGYYLLGMKRWQPALFRDKPWSTSSLYQKTLATAASENLSVSTLEILNDIDTIEDLDISNIDPASV